MNKRGMATVLYAIFVTTVSACGERPDSGVDRENSPELPPSRIVVGAEVPDFALASLQDSDVSLTREDVAGKVYLIDFWATWCLPCVAELPNLHQAYEEYGGRGFEIVSVAMGDRREHIAQLRETEWPMPWLHAFEPLDSDQAELFELFGVPKAILVDSSNTIVGVDEDVRGDQLLGKLAELFGSDGH